jgi:hypothetical protein
MGRHRDASKYIDQVIDMVEEGRLETGGVSAQKLCLIAVAYHNRAVEYVLQPPARVRQLHPFSTVMDRSGFALFVRLSIVLFQLT